MADPPSPNENSLPDALPSGPALGTSINGTPTEDGVAATFVTWYYEPKISFSYTALSAFKAYDLKSPTTFPVPSLKFDVTLKKPSSKTTIEIRDDTTVLRSQEFTSGAMIEKGDHIWLWDGYSDDNKLDTRKLKQAKTLKAVVRTDAGEDSVKFSYNEDFGHPQWVDVRVSLDSKTIDFLVYVNIGQNWNPLKSPTDDEYKTAKQQIKDGIARYWSRNSAQDPKRKITIAGVDYDVTAFALDDASVGVEYTVEHGLFSNRPCNYGVMIPGAGISFTVPHSDDYQKHGGAHEFGHSVLKDAFGFTYSLTHKGTSTVVQTQVDGNPYPTAPAEIDLMKYMEGGDLTDKYKRTSAVEEDVKALLACVRAGFD